MVRSLVPYDITICGIPDLESHREKGITHALSIIDPDEPDPSAFRRYKNVRRLLIRCDDVVQPYAGFQPPSKEDVQKLLEFGATLPDEAHGGHLLIHCHAGISRSTAAAGIIMAQHNPGKEREAFLHLLDMRPHAWPNTRIVTFADQLLDRQGAMMDGLVAFRRELLKRKPQLADIIRNIGRGDELP